jgi:hypothetical protein
MFNRCLTAGRGLVLAPPSMRKNYLAVPLFIVLCFADHATATTVVYAVTPTGMVIGADGKTVPSGTAIKIFLLRGKYVVADLYAENAKSNDGGVMAYDFPVWIKQVDQHTDANVSVSGLAEIIKNQMTTTFAFAIDAIKTGNFTRDQAVVTGVDVYIVQYVIAGYEKGIPFVHSLTLMPDWGTKTVNGPFDVSLKEKKGLGWRGQGIALSQINIADTKEQKELSAKIPVEFNALRKGNDLTLHQASNVVRAMLGMESKSNPRYVGFPITVVTIPKIGHGWVRTYERDVPALSRLPKGARTKHQPATQN